MFYAVSWKKIKKALFFLLLPVLLVIMAGMMVNIRYPLHYIDIINENTAQYGLDPALVCAIIHAESKFNDLARSHKGASGLMQVTESTANWLAEEMGLTDYGYEKIFEPELNIKMGCYYLNRLLRRYEDLDVALAAYNAGSGNVNKWLADSKYSTDGETLAEIPFKETRDYIARVRRNKWIYDILLALTGSAAEK